MSDEEFDDMIMELRDYEQTVVDASWYGQA